MRRISKLLLLSTLFVLSLASCLEDFDFGQNPNDYTIVIEGVITNISRLNHVKLTKSSNNFNNLIEPFAEQPIADPIIDALVVISDDFGNTYTLNTQDSIVVDQWIYDDDRNVIDTIQNKYPIDKKERGVYKSNGLVGHPGRTYFLSVIHNGIEYNAKGYMNPLPPKVDSVQVNTIVIKEIDGETALVPSFFFQDPPQKNYYYFDLSAYFSGSRWDVSIMDDELLESAVSGFNIDDGVHPDWWRVNYNLGGITEYIEMAYISKEVYEYYENLIGQFNNDGGVYSPSPASPVSNISNGALGVFRVSSVNIIEIEY